MVVVMEGVVAEGLKNWGERTVEVEVAVAMVAAKSGC